MSTIRIKVKEDGKRVESGWLCLSYAEDLGPAVGADARDGWLSVLERDGLGVLDLHVHLALDAVCLWHVLFI